MTMRAYGLRPDLPDPNDKQIIDRFGSVQEVAFPLSCSNEKLLYQRPTGRDDLPEVLLQYSTQTCVAQQAAEAVWCEQRRLGIHAEDCMLISPAATYYAGLRREHGKEGILVDMGSRPRDVWAAMRELGTAAWEDCPLVESNLNVVTDGPPPGAWMGASDPEYVTDLRYDTVSLSDRPDMIRRSIIAGHCVGIGLTLSASFEDIQDDQTIWAGRFSEPIVGRHMVHVYAYDEAGVWIQNWWRQWGNALGRGRLSWDVITSPETTDFVTAVLDLTKW
jgi:hypothetical protein